MPHKKATNGNTPATQHDLSLLAGNMQIQFDEVKRDIRQLKADVRELQAGQRRIEKTLERHENALKAIMAILEENNRLLKELRGLPQRVDRIHRAVFPNR